MWYFLLAPFIHLFIYLYDSLLLSIVLFLTLCMLHYSITFFYCVLSLIYIYMLIQICEPLDT